MVSRREFFRGAGVVAVSAGLVSRVGAASLPELAPQVGGRSIRVRMRTSKAAAILARYPPSRARDR